MKHISTSLLASCLIANMGLVAVAQTETTTTSSEKNATSTEKKSKHCGFRKHRLRNIFKKSKKTDTTTK